MPPIDTSIEMILLWALLGYIIGSIAFGMVLAQLMGLGNLRSIGSGNIGATNVLRTGNKKAAALTLLLDGAKGAVAVFLARSFAGEDAAQVAALGAMIGHCYPIWLGFRGGKGVATFLGVLLALAWPVGLACCAVWAVAAALTRISSMGALAAAASSTVFMVLFGYGEMVLLSIALTLLIFWRHRDNISRIRAGTESRIGQKG
ncbi:glycerol-3-phosphate 1-O-acyltransferase PlsY [Sulfitobacter sp. PS-8MA]|uniref:glycerol-3-phosphate 1-O-acyltransferase PlsY n=1 Tax=Sulfitobacter sp. PS-8MA TaxID=3237707 RepID=UPI0034C6974D